MAVAGLRLLLPLLVGLTASCWPASAKIYCPLEWNANASMPGGIDRHSPCPYGHSLNHFDVTIPNYLDNRVVKWTCVAWGVIPFLVVAFGVFDTILNAVRLKGIGTRELAFLTFIIVMVGLNELVFKSFWRQPRPERSCLLSCGFPSGHSVMSIGFFTLMYLDAAYRVKPSTPIDVDGARDHVKAMSGMVGRGNTFLGWTLREWLVADVRTWATVIPLSRAHTINQFDFVCFSFWWAVFLLPVPFSRVVLNDHFPSQVLVGSVIGFVEASIYFFVIRHCLLPQVNHLLGQRVAYVFVHDFPLPVYQVTSKCYFLLARAEDGRRAASTELLQELVTLHQELGWYVRQADPKTVCGWLAYDEDKVIAKRELKRLQALREEVAGHLNDVREDVGGDDILESIGWVDDSDSLANTSAGDEDGCAAF